MQTITPAVAAEKKRRDDIWETLRKAGSPNTVSRSRIKDLRIHRGIQGIFRDKVTTVALSPTGVTVSILHTPESYKDKLSNESLTYKYPKTARPGNYDTNEIQATKRCQQFKLPLFIVIGNQADADREVRLGKVVECDDETRCFRIRFSTGQGA